MTYGTEAGYKCRTAGCIRPCKPPFSKCDLCNGLNTEALGISMDKYMEQLSLSDINRDGEWEHQQELENEELWELEQLDEPQTN